MLSELTKVFLLCCYRAPSSIKEGMNDLLLPKGSTEQYCVLSLAFSAAPRNQGISQQQQGDQQVVVGAKKSEFAEGRARWGSFTGVFSDFPVSPCYLVKVNSTKWSCSTKLTENCIFSA